MSHTFHTGVVMVAQNMIHKCGAWISGKEREREWEKERERERENNYVSIQEMKLLYMR